MNEGRNRFCLGSGVGCFAIVVIFFAAAWKIRTSIAGSLTTDPAEISAIVDSLVPLDPPSGWSWARAANMHDAQIAWLSQQGSRPEDPLVIAYSLPQDGGRGKERLFVEGFEMSRRRDDRGRMVGEASFTLLNKKIAAIETIFDEELRDFTFILPRGERTVFLVFYGPKEQVTQEWVQSLLNRAR